MINLMTVIGARPQFVKSSIITHCIAKHFHNDFSQTLVHTGQHYSAEMSSNIFLDLGVPFPDLYLDVNQQSHTDMTANIMLSLNKQVINKRPDCILVFGDTNSTLAAALVAAQNNIPLMHIESGLRSFNREMPEEKNRIVTDHLSQLLFAPTVIAFNQLLSEGIKKNIIHNSGDVMYDVFCQYVNKLGLQSYDNGHILVTIHREENSNIKAINKILSSLSILSSTHKVIFPVHPRIKKLISSQSHLYPNIDFINPLNYTDLLKTLMSSKFVVTDSGGLQKEAFFANKLCITLRKETEWTELIDVGANYLYDIQNDETPLLDIITKLNENAFGNRLYGDGNSSLFILNKIKQFME